MDQNRLIYNCEQWADALQQYLLTGEGNLRAIVMNLIDSGSTVELTATACKTCELHKTYFPKEIRKRRVEEEFVKVTCTYFHEFCINCGKSYIKDVFKNYGLTFSPPCPICVNINAPDCTILDYQGLVEQCFGADFVNNHLTMLMNKQTVSEKRKEVCSLANSNSCRQGSVVLKAGRCFHNLCDMCIENIVRSDMVNMDYRCPAEGCEEYIFHQTIREALDNKPELLRLLWGKLNLLDVKQLICKNCKNLCEVDPTQEIYQCVQCNYKMCPKCGELYHEGESCMDSYNKNLQFAIREISPGSTNEIDREAYSYAFSSFNQSIESNEWGVEKIEIINNPDLYEKFKKKTAEIASMNIDPCEEVVWHTTSDDNVITSIAKNGFYIGGVGGHKIRVGKIFGLGIYTAVEPNFTFRYRGKVLKVICCRAVRGQSGSVANSEADLNRRDVHSHIPRGNQNIHIFFTPEQVLPRFIISYKRLN